MAAKSRIAWINPRDLSQRIDHDRIAELIDVLTVNDADDKYGWWELDMPPADDNDGDYPSPERDEVWSKYEGALESVFEDLLDKHQLEMRKLAEYGWVLLPKTTWDAAANAIRQTINGVGSFYFSSLKEFLDSGPYTARAAVLTHLHWLKRWWEVYEGSKCSSVFERELR